MMITPAVEESASGEVNIKPGPENILSAAVTGVHRVTSDHEIRVILIAKLVTIKNKTETVQL